MMYKMTTMHAPEKCFLFIITQDAFEIFDFDIELLALYNIPAGIFTEVTW